MSEAFISGRPNSGSSPRVGALCGLWPDMDIFELPRRWPVYSDGLLLDAVDCDQRFRLPRPSLMGLLLFSTPRPVGVTALEGFTIRARDPGREERDAGRLGGTEGGSIRDPEGRLGWNGLDSSSRAERCSIFTDDARVDGCEST